MSLDVTAVPRRPILARLLLVPLVLSLWVGCGPVAPNRTITIWHQMVPAERVMLAEEIARFEKEHPGVKIEALYKETEELRSGFQAAVLAGVGPELVYGPSDPIGPFQVMGLVQDLSPWFESDDLADFSPEALTYLPEIADPSRKELLHVGDRVGNHLALVYNRKFIQEPPKTTDEWIELARRETVDENGDGVIDRYGLVWNYIEPYFAIPFLTGFGAWLFDEADPRKPTLDSPAVVAALEFILRLRDEDRVIPKGCDYEMADALFKSGKAAMIINGDWSWGDYLNNPKLDAAIAPLPVVSKTGIPMRPMIDAKGYALNVLARDEKRDLAIAFIRHMTSAETQRRFMHRLRTLPSRVSVHTDPMLASDATLSASLQQLRNGKRTPVVPELRAVWDGMRPHYQSLLGGEETPQEASARMQTSSELLIRRMKGDAEATTTAAQLLKGTALLGILAWAVWQRKTIARLPSDLQRLPLAYWFIVPSLLVLIATIVYPFFYNVVLSFSNMSLNRFRDWQLIGWDNYRDVLMSPTFYVVLAKTILWTVVNVFFHVALGVLLAVTLHGPVRGKSIYRLLLIIPWAVPSYITALTWRGMFDLHFGAFNLLGTRLLGMQRIDWLGEPNLAFLACVITNIWLGVPFMMIITLGGLQGISKELYEAARIDRASRWAQFWHITVPMLRPVLIPAITLGAIWTFNNLNVVWLVSNGGQPSDKTHILVSYVYRAVFNLYQFGNGAALSMIIFGILLLFSWAFLNRTRATEGI